MSEQLLREYITTSLREESLGSKIVKATKKGEEGFRAFAQNRWGEAFDKLTPEKLRDKAVMFFYGEDSTQGREISRRKKLEAHEKEMAQAKEEYEQYKKETKKRLAELEKKGSFTSEEQEELDKIKSDLARLKAASEEGEKRLKVYNEWSEKAARFDSFFKKISADPDGGRSEIAEWLKKDEVIRRGWKFNDVVAAFNLETKVDRRTLEIFQSMTEVENITRDDALIIKTRLKRAGIKLEEK